MKNRRTIGNAERSVTRLDWCAQRDYILSRLHYIDITTSLAVALAAAVAMAVELSAAAILTSAAAATTLVGVTVTSSPTVTKQTAVVSLALGRDPNFRLLGSCIAIIAAVAPMDLQT
ncbi:hypothetical protein Ctob_004995 [Chrysochromulina tobinii]|uniref:Uncharacterized protein n=1 Tax=Chrysochromulina tobinii TaxID=1460289 RepID=A0A0M0JVI3_9EUKA|nr:hypothetical protein Ctob_004995 [Chrysochromulina tobinii]|eukprot:KOO30534.1 hypothetical protein Ctob_004995 [Chrysochromulina sp. CCMP291]